MMHKFSLHSTIIITALVGLLLLRSADGFSIAPSVAIHLARGPATTTTTRAETTTQLNAWSLPVTNKFGTFSTTWFDVKDPTGRKIVYNDDADQYDSFSFVASLGDDWPSLDDDTTTWIQQQQRQQPTFAEPPVRRFGLRPLRRAAAWLRTRFAEE